MADAHSNICAQNNIVRSINLVIIIIIDALGMRLCLCKTGMLTGPLSISQMTHE